MSASAAITDPVTGQAWSISPRWPKCAVHSPEASAAHRIRTTDPEILARIKATGVTAKECNCYHCARSVELDRLVVKHLADGRQHTDALIHAGWEIGPFEAAYQRASVAALDAMGLRS